MYQGTDVMPVVLFFFHRIFVGFLFPYAHSFVVFDVRLPGSDQI